MERKNCFTYYDESEKLQLENTCNLYMDFLSRCKTERECVKEIIAMAEKAGYKPDGFVSPDSTNHMGRPYPYMIFRNMEMLKVSSVSAVIKVGDTISDIKEGKNAGVFTIGVIEGSSEAGLTKDEYNSLNEQERLKLIEKVTDRYKQAGADAVITDIRGVLDYIVR